MNKCSTSESWFVRSVLPPKKHLDISGSYTWRPRRRSARRRRGRSGGAGRPSSGVASMRGPMAIGRPRHSMTRVERQPAIGLSPVPSSSVRDCVTTVHLNVLATAFGLVEGRNVGAAGRQDRIPHCNLSVQSPPSSGAVITRLSTYEYRLACNGWRHSDCKPDGATHVLLRVIRSSAGELTHVPDGSINCALVSETKK